MALAIRLGVGPRLPEPDRHAGTGAPLVTIDPVDARDHDDAVAAMPDDDPRNEGSMVLWVAIADVAHYVRPQSALDKEARHRGNSTYFPDRVVPMLPDVLSGDLCSLHEGVDRPVSAVRMRIDAQGNKIGHDFHRGMMNSMASLSYEQAQAAADGTPDDQAAPLMDNVIRPLFADYGLLKAARARRQPLDLDLPERRIELTPDGRVKSVAFRERFDAHRLIEEFMVLANVAAAEELTRLRRPLLFRVHEEPSPEKLNALRDVAEASGFALAKGQVLQTSHLNRLLAQAQRRGQAFILELRAPETGELLAGAAFVREAAVLVYLFAASTAAGRAASSRSSVRTGRSGTGPGGCGTRSAAGVLHRRRARGELLAHAQGDRSPHGRQPRHLGARDQRDRGRHDRRRRPAQEVEADLRRAPRRQPHLRPVRRPGDDGRDRPLAVGERRDPR